MTLSPRPLLAGNWKMNGMRAQLDEIEALAGHLAQANEAARAPVCDLMICPPATLLEPM
ncbi:MAG: triose-phosphate isomerase, partial [Hyphomicrobiales bacterium]